MANRDKNINFAIGNAKLEASLILRPNESTKQALNQVDLLTHDNSARLGQALTQLVMEGKELPWKNSG